MKKVAVIKGAGSSQFINDFDTLYDSIVEPFFDTEKLLLLYYANTYHRRAINIKSKLFSQIQETNLDNILPTGTTPQQFLQACILEFELYGNLFLEKTPLNTLHIIPGYQARLNINRQIYQKHFLQAVKLEGYHFKTYSPRSRFYGEPDYLAALKAISTTQKADAYNNAYLENGAKPGFAIIFENAEPTPEQLTAFKNFFGDNFKGYDNANKTIVLSGTSDMGEKPAKIRLEKLSEVEDISFKLLKEVNRDEIIASHGVPPRLVGIVSAGQLGGGSELISQLHMFNELEIKPKTELITSFFNSIGIKLKLKELDTTNYKDDTDIITNLVDRNIISVQEAREVLNWQTQN